MFITDLGSMIIFVFRYIFLIFIGTSYVWNRTLVFAKIPVFQFNIKVWPE